MALYFDTSALVKLIIPEEGTEALETFINRADCGLWTSELSRTELMRACVRRGADASQVRQLLWSFSTLTFDTEMFDLAGRLLPVELRSLDALHLAAAPSIGRDLQAIVTYDKRMADAARKSGIPVESPC